MLTAVHPHPATNFHLGQAFATGHGCVTIGRVENNTISCVALNSTPNATQRPPVADKLVTMVSRHHAKLDVVAGQLQLTDLGAVNGTYVNDQRIEAQGSRVLQENDVISFGGPATIVIKNQVLQNPWVWRVRQLHEFLASYVPPSLASPAAQQAAAAAAAAAAAGHAGSAPAAGLGAGPGAVHPGREMYSFSATAAQPPAAELAAEGAAGAGVEEEAVVSPEPAAEGSGQPGSIPVQEPLAAAAAGAAGAAMAPALAGPAVDGLAPVGLAADSDESAELAAMAAFDAAMTSQQGSAPEPAGAVPAVLNMPMPEAGQPMRSIRPSFPGAILPPQHQQQQQQPQQQQPSAVPWAANVVQPAALNLQDATQPMRTAFGLPPSQQQQARGVDAWVQAAHDGIGSDGVRAATATATAQLAAAPPPAAAAMANPALGAATAPPAAATGVAVPPQQHHPPTAEQQQQPQQQAIDLIDLTADSPERPQQQQGLGRAPHGTGAGAAAGGGAAVAATAAGGAPEVIDLVNSSPTKRRHGTRGHAQQGAKRAKPSPEAHLKGPAEAAPAAPAAAAAIAAATESAAEAAAAAAAGAPAAAAEISSELQGHLICAICQELPVMTHAMVPCGHCFCAECLAGWLGTKKLECPQCREKATAPPVRQRVMDNTVEVLARSLPADDLAARKEKLQSFEENKANIERQLAAPWQKNSQRVQGGGSGGAGGSGQARAGGDGGGVLAALAASIFGGGPFGLNSNDPLLNLAWEPPEVPAWGGGGARGSGRRRHAAAAARPLPLVLPGPGVLRGPPQNEFRVELAPELNTGRCAGCGQGIHERTTRIGMRPQLQPQGRHETLPWRWYHIACLPAALWHEVRLNGVGNLRNIPPAAQAEVRERMQLQRR